VSDSTFIVFAVSIAGGGAVSVGGRCSGSGYRTGITLELGSPVHQKL